MSDELGKILELLGWIGDEPFRLFATLCLVISIVTFYFFRNEAPGYKVFAVILLFVGAGGIGYSVISSGGPQPQVSESETQDPKTSEGLARIQSAVSSGNCLETYAVQVAAIAKTFPSDQQVTLANEIVQKSFEIKKFVDNEFPGSFGECNSSVVGKGFTSACQPGSDAFHQVAEDIVAGDLVAAQVNADTADTIFRTCKS